MKILLTSGGTKTKIDDVRHIGNMSSGTFGNHMCVSLLREIQQGDNLDVTFLYAKDSKCPHEIKVDLTTIYHTQDQSQAGILLVNEGYREFQRYALLKDCINQYHPIIYSDFNDYAKKLRDLLNQGDWDIVILAAAVSDYEPVNKQEGKISSEEEKLTINLQQTPKLIREVRSLCPNTFLVGFKLLVGSTQEQLEEAMVKQTEKAKTDMVVGNDLRDIKADKHRLTILGIDGLFYTYENKPGKRLAEVLVQEILEEANTIKSLKG